MIIYEQPPHKKVYDILENMDRKIELDDWLINSIFKLQNEKKLPQNVEELLNKYTQQKIRYNI